MVCNKRPHVVSSMLFQAVTLTQHVTAMLQLQQGHPYAPCCINAAVAALHLMALLWLAVPSLQTLYVNRTFCMGAMLYCLTSVQRYTVSHACNVTLSHAGAVLHCVTWVHCYTVSHECNAPLSHMGAMLHGLTWVNATLSHMGAMLCCLTRVKCYIVQVIQTRKMACRPGDYSGQIYNPDTHRLCSVGAGSTIQQANSCMNMCLIVPCFKPCLCSAAQTECQQRLLIPYCIPSPSSMPF